MIPVDQTTFVPKAGEGAGNCMAACIASLLELPIDAVPNFAAAPEGEDGAGRQHWFNALERWLAARGLGLAVWYFEEETGARDWYATPGIPMLASGKSPRGEFQHAVIVQDGELLHDPHPSREGLDGHATELWALLPLDPAARIPDGATR